MTDNAYDLHEWIAKKEAEKAVPGTLPPEFWEARPELSAIRDGARRKMVSPETALGAVLARIATIGRVQGADEYHPLLPPIIVKAQPISLFAALLGDPGAGKAGGNELASELLPDHPEWAVIGNKPATAEALADKFWTWNEELDDKGKNIAVQTQGNKAWLIHFDEGALFEGLASRLGSGLLSDLHTAWNSSSIGNETSTDIRNGRKRKLPDYSYRVSMIMNLQLETAQFLIRNSGSGWAQRFLWCQTRDPHMSANLATMDPAPPLGWEPPRIDARGSDGRHIRGDHWYMPVCGEAVQHTRKLREQVGRGELELDPLDTHGNLMRLRVAACLALLFQRVTVDEEVWALAGQVMEASGQTRALAVQYAKKIAAREKEQRQAEHMVFTVSGDNAKEESWINKCMLRIVKVLGEKGPMKVGYLKDNITERQRAVFPEALDRLIDQGRVRLRDDQQYELVQP